MNQMINKIDSQTILSIEKLIKAPKDKVFAAWTEPALIKQWFFPGNMHIGECSTELIVGGHYRISMVNEKQETNTVTGKYLEIVKPEKIVFTWGWEGPDRYESIVTVLFTEEAEGTKINIEHDRLMDQKAVELHNIGWLGCLENLSLFINKF